MKSISLFIILLFSQLTSSQTYILDSSFGNNGQIQYNNSSFVPSSVVLSNNNYYYFGNNGVIKTNFIGQIENDFGVNGMLTFPSLPANQYLILKEIIFTNNAFYAYGYINYSTNGVNADDIILYKFNESGIFDSTFGLNGAARIDLGDKESVSSIIVKTDGSLYCSGTRSNSIVYFKLTSQGSLDYSFDTNGYKTIIAYPNSYFGSLIPYGNGNYLLVGLNKDVDNYGALLVTKVDESGVVDTFFGNNGYKTSPLAVGMGSHTLYNVQFYQNKLYVHYRYSFGLTQNSSYIKIFDLNVDQSIYDEAEAFSIDFIVKSDGMYIARNNYCGPGGCSGEFTLCKRNLDGTLDTTFHNNGIYTYNFPDQTGSGFPVQSILRCLQVNDSGEILLGGFSSSVNGLVRKFAAIRITQGALGLTQFNSPDLSIQPNPFNAQVSIKTKRKISDVRVYSLNGSEIFTPKIAELDGTVTIDLSSINSSGVYILKFYSDNTQIIKRLIKY